MALRNATLMSAVLWTGIPFNVSVGQVPVPTIQHPTDVIVRVTAAAICGTDLHIYRGTYGAPGHEAMGVVSEIGNGVKYHKVGDYVVIPDRIDTDHLSMETERYTAFGSQALPGSQAEYVRIPSADQVLITTPSVNGTAPSLDYLLLSDIFPTAWAAVKYSGFQDGDTVAVFGAGPVGLLAAYSAILRSASKIYVVDTIPARLALAKSIGAIPIDYKVSDPVAQIRALEPQGVQRFIDGVGYEAVNPAGAQQADIILKNMMAVTGYRGGLGIAGVYPNQNSTKNNPPISIGQAWSNALTVGMGAVNPVRQASLLHRMITNGKAKPSFVFSKEARIEEAPAMYAAFEKHQESKIVFRF
ncbi:GroES-like protein [Aulographum hederae CBS 113979]|uniref:GroES-like protein n=1 Tax=Aulographum hederae CBS 113979 TaxID=1176131 RepID=A0A6G1H1F1_9PEZI|nr:GroES-like protein [Aulographum hederae CBS 113979]